MYVLWEAKPPMWYVICSSRTSNIHKLIDDLIRVTYLFLYYHQSPIRSNNKDAIHIHDSQDKPWHRLLHNDGKVTRRNRWSTLHRHDKPHDGSDGKIVAAVKTTAWRVKHGSIALVLDNADYHRLTRYQSETTSWLDPPTAMSGTIGATSTPFEIMTIKNEQKKLHKVYDMQDSVTDIGVDRIVASVDEQ